MPSFFFFLLFIWFLPALGLYCCLWLSLGSISGDPSLVVVHRLLNVVTFLVVEHSSRDTWASVIAAPRFYSGGSVVLEHGLSCSTACGIFPDQGSMSPALAGEFLTSEPPGKSCLLHRGLCQDFLFWELPILKVRKSHHCQLLASSFCLYGAEALGETRICHWTRLNSLVVLGRAP